MIRNPATRWNQAKTTRLRDCTIATKISTFIPEALISGSQKSSEISQNEVFADHDPQGLGFFALQDFGDEQLYENNSADDITEEIAGPYGQRFGIFHEGFYLSSRLVHIQLSNNCLRNGRQLFLR
jgi:hypothetical protein